MAKDVARIIERVGGHFSEDVCPNMEAARAFGPSQSKAAFRQVGLKSFHNLIELADLEPNEQVLDIGCGIGRVALPLSWYLNDQARYVGIDPVAPAVQWCADNISSRCKNFEFLCVDWFNRMYNKQGAVNPATYTFPFESNQFDLIYLFSVFTHVLPPTLVNYLSEIKRMLSRDGRVLMTMLIIDEETRSGLDKGEANRDYFPVNEVYWTDHETIHESAVCYEYDYVKKVLTETGLDTVKHFIRGGWRRNLPGQDILVVQNSQPSK